MFLFSGTTDFVFLLLSMVSKSSNKNNHILFRIIINNDFSGTTDVIKNNKILYVNYLCYLESI